MFSLSLVAVLPSLPLFFLCSRSELAFFRISSYNLGRAHAKTSLSLHFREEDEKKVGAYSREKKEDNYDLKKEMMIRP